MMRFTKRDVIVFMSGFLSAIVLAGFSYFVSPLIFLFVVGIMLIYIFYKGYKKILTSAKERFNHTWYITFGLFLVCFFPAVGFTAAASHNKIMLFPALFFILMMLTIVGYHVFGIIKNEIVRFVDKMRDLFDATRG